MNKKKPLFATLGTQINHPDAHNVVKIFKVRGTQCQYEVGNISILPTNYAEDFNYF